MPATRPAPSRATPRRRPRRRTARLLLVVTALAACGRAPVQSAPVPRDTATAPAAVRADAAAPRGRAADVQFMQHMMGHHAQAVTMTALVPTRTAREDMRRLAQRIALSQGDELALMRGWLHARGAQADHAAHAMPDMAASMPGMATAAELAGLTAARGADFDRQFLTLMIRHHEGALAMVAALFATPGAGQEPEIFRFASDVDADQRAEIRRMRTLQDAASAPTPRR